jgi:hypothetical protein
LNEIAPPRQLNRYIAPNIACLGTNEMSNRTRLAPPLLADDDPNAIEIVSLWKSFNSEKVGMSLLPDIFTEAEDWGFLMADILINAVSAQKQLFGVDEKDYCGKALQGMHDRIKKIGISLEGGVYGDIANLIDDL